MPTNYFNLNGKIALVTGASSGLGTHFAKVLADEGCMVVLAARRVDRLEREVAAIGAAGGKAIAVAMDVSSPKSVAQAFESIREQVGAIDILINNAGIGSDPTRFLDTGEEEWHRVIDVNP